MLAALMALAAGVAAEDERSEVIRLPLTEQFSLQTLCRSLADDFGLPVPSAAAAGDQDRQHLAARLAALATATDNIVSGRIEDEQVVIELDRLRLRRDRDHTRQRFRMLMGEWFPGLAASAAARHQLIVYSPTLPDGDASPALSLPAATVLLVHGLDDSGRIWRQTIPPLLAAGYTVCRFEYPNDQAIADSAALLAAQLTALHQRGVREVRIVAHSMGGLLSREVLTNSKWYGGRGGGHVDRPDIVRLITVGTPHYGSELARARWATELREQIVRTCSGDGVLFGAVFDGCGEARFDLVPGSDFLTTLNARPLPAGVAITSIAGIASPVRARHVNELLGHVRESLPGVWQQACDEIERGVGELVAGAGDGCVSLASTRLAGVDDQVVVAANHLTMLRSLRPDPEHLPPAIPILLDRLGRRE